MNKNESINLFERAKKVMPGGVNSPVRAFKAVGGSPLFIDSAKGAYIYDVDGNKYLDYVGSWGPMILGHNNKDILDAVKMIEENGLSFGAPTLMEIILAETMIELVPNLEMVRMVNSGTEAVMSAVRLARGYTNRNKIIKFEGCYHGHSDSMLVKAGSGALTCGSPDSLGIPPCVAEDTLIASYNDLDTVSGYFEKYPEEIACVIVEPVAANMGVVAPADGFLQGLRSLCDANGSLLIFDEVITGFRLAKGGAQEYFNIKADIITYGKIIGGGMPVGAYGASKKIMECVSPCGGVYQAGTLSGNPVAMAAGICQLKQLKDPSIYEHINNMGARLRKGLNEIIDKHDINATVTGVGSLTCLFGGVKQVTNFAQAKGAKADFYSKYFIEMLENGVYLAPAQYEAMFISYAHKEKEIDETLNIAEKILKKIK